MVSNRMSEKDFKFFVIGAGLPRTGTLSMKTALDKLLPGKCMHFSTVFNSDLKEFFRDVLSKSSTDLAFRDYFERHNIVAGVDTPFIFQYKRALKLFPEAKVVLTVRDPSSWVKSMGETVYKSYKEPYRFPMSLMMHFNPMKMRLWDYVVAELRDAIESIGQKTGEEYFEKWVEDVKQTVPAERLLIFNVKEGWEPLCKFLNVPIPNEPFPNVNDTKKFQKDIRNFKATVYLMAMGIFVVPVIVSYGALRFFNYL